MAGEASSSHKRKTKLSRQESSKSGKESEIDVDHPIAGASSAQTTRGGIRVYKIVVLGDGGVGKSGKIMVWLLYEYSLTIMHF